MKKLGILALVVLLAAAAFALYRSVMPMLIKSS
jgi:hypothetical protein